MVDQTSQFYAILTNVGAAKQANADALGIPWVITQMAIGDANGTDPQPSAAQTALINEWRRAPLNQLKVDDKDSSIIVAEQIIPADIGGRWIREIALYDADGAMVAVANCPPTYKPLLNQGSGRTQVVRMNLVVSSSSNVQLKIDPSVVLATREYVDGRITEEINKLDNKQSVRVATTANIALSGLQSVDGVQLAAGDRVLVKNQTAGKENGLYVAAVGSWPRTADADASSEVTSGLVLAVEQGATQADTIWQLITDGSIVLGVTVLTFRDITDGFARLLSPAFAGAPTTPTPPQFDTSTLIVNAAYVKRMGVEYGGYTNYSASANLGLADCGKLAAFGHATNALVAQLPTGAQIPAGATVKLLCTLGTMTVTAAAGDTIDAVNAPGNIAMAQGDTAEFIRNGTLWRLVGGSVLLKYAAVMQGAYWTTPVQFDNTRKLATTEFVQRSLGNDAGFAILVGGTTLNASHAGKLIYCGAGGNYTVTLPSAVAVAPGTKLPIVMFASQPCSIATQLGQSMYFNGSQTLSTITLGLGDSLTLESDGQNWYAVGGTAQLKYSTAFGSSLIGPTCYQKLPSGDIEQWGLYVAAPSGSDTVITLPVGMLAAPTLVELTFANYTNGENVGNSPVLQARNSTPGTITVRNLFGAAASFYWKVRGRV
ncbi:phage tail protein [Pseudomonas asiatica]|uniref:Phage tail protein n=1 Tax=Pseudomonas asiatica TaxID=2219225 RepID=A0ABU5L472_9PSED|nr:phage tail protein [Pseudomonas asiatica]MDZ5740957.1 phage tail protein [Pseudomonas asiatica]MDZ5746278.1 phage tail protein [Pseudomonas asiatica]MDZ5751277.1 phage tail protein [Pseudomonas asiatica]MDZ5756255.1 phage tail protein [Pseudomonas asiatica]